MSTYQYFKQSESESNLIRLYEDDKPYEGHNMFNAVDIGNMSFDEYLGCIKRKDRYIKWRDGKIINYSKIIDDTLPSGNIYENVKVSFITAMKQEYGTVTFQILYKNL